MEIKTGKCHCGKVEFQVQLKNGLEKIRRCNCSLCRRKGAIVASVLLENLTITKGAENLTLYQWGTMTAKHYFCKTCGIYTHHQRRSNPKEFGFNIACLNDVNPFDFRDVTIVDGASV